MVTGTIESLRTDLDRSWYEWIAFILDLVFFFDYLCQCTVLVAKDNRNLNFGRFVLINRVNSAQKMSGLKISCQKKMVSSS